MAGVAKEKPPPPGPRTAQVVIGDDLSLRAQAGLAHRLLELGRRGHRVAASTLFSGDVLEVDKHGTRDMAARVFVASVSTDQVPAEVDHANVRVAGMLAQPAGVDQRAKSQLGGDVA